MFRDNFLFVEKFNAAETGDLRLGMTKFANMNLDEFKASFTTDLTPSRSEE